MTSQKSYIISIRPMLLGVLVLGKRSKDAKTKLKSQELKS